MSVKEKQPKRVERPLITKAGVMVLVMVMIVCLARYMSWQRPPRPYSTARSMYGASVLNVLTRSNSLVVLSNSAYFKIVADAMHLSFEELGIKHTINTTVDYSDHTTTYIVFTTHEEHFRMPNRYISYNYEQLTTDKKWSPQLWKRLQSAEMVWDYSLENIKVMNTHNITHTVHVPLGYAENMESSVLPKEYRDVDIMFIGAMNDRRRSMLHPLLQLQRQNQQQQQRHVLGQANLAEEQKTVNFTNTRDLQIVNTSTNDVTSTAIALNVVAGGNFWGNDLLELYSRSKIALNLHYYSGQTILEIHRILPLIANSVLVLSEPSNDPWMDSQYSSIVDFTSDKDMTHSVLNMLQLDIVDEAHRRYQALLACCSYTQYIESVLAMRIRSKLGSR